MISKGSFGFERVIDSECFTYALPLVLVIYMNMVLVKYGDSVVSRYIYFSQTQIFFAEHKYLHNLF